jgi:hypothetical protein
MSADSIAPETLPPFLRTEEDFRAYLDEEFGPEGSAGRGRRFMDAMLLLLPQLPLADEFSGFKASNTVSHDGGVDISSEPNPAGAVIRAQTKYKIERVDDLDSILSKFSEYEQKSSVDVQPDLFEALEGGRIEEKPVFVIVTSSNLAGIQRRYEDSHRPSLQFYRELRRENRLHIVDGPEILETLRHKFIKASRLPARLALSSVNGWLPAGDVYLGVVRGSDIVQLIDEHGDGLFFENIREWLGLGEGRVNQSITDTIQNEPERMLERNNGITIRGEAVTYDGAESLVAERAAIINGCQTTMCLWHARPTAPDLFVQVKVVQSTANEDAWTIARSANYQNDVSQIDLELARYLRPQLVNKAATAQGKGLAAARQDTMSSLLAKLTETEITYNLTKYVFLGLFCSPPNQLFNDNYSKIRIDVLQEMYGDDPNAEDRVYSSIFAMVEAGQRASSVPRETYTGQEYADLYQRLLDETRPRYAAYQILLACCGALRFNLAERYSDARQESDRLRGFFEGAAEITATNPERFTDAYLMAYKVLAQTVNRSSEDEDKTQCHVA